MRLRFPPSRIPDLAGRYDSELRDWDREQSKLITEQVFPDFKKRGFLTKPEFLAVCAWKTHRSKSRCASNDPNLIREISQISLTTESEELRIKVWTLLAGVKWPTASVFLHFMFSDRYPILDVRALESIGISPPPPYTFQFWMRYTTFCRSLAKETGVSMRILDQALWKFSEINQR